MDTIEAVKTRRSIKNFDKNHRMSESEKRQFLELAMTSPTAFHLQHNRFLVIEDEALKQQIKEVAWNQPQISDCSLLLALCADLKAWNSDNVSRCWAATEENVQNWVKESTQQTFANNPIRERDEAIRSISIAAGQMMITARGMGLDTCAIGGFDYDAVAKLINLPENYVIGMLLPVGKRAAEPYPRHDVLDFDTMVKVDKF